MASLSLNCPQCHSLYKIQNFLEHYEICKCYTTPPNTHLNLSSPILSVSAVTFLPKACKNENVAGFQRSIKIEIRDMVGFRCFPSVISMMYKNKLEETGGIIVRGPPGFIPAQSVETLKAVQKMKIPKGYALTVEKRSETAECFIMIHEQRRYTESFKTMKECLMLRNRKEFVDESKLDSEFWDIIRSKEYKIEYASGIDGNGFDKHLDGWNLQNLKDDLQTCKLFYDNAEGIISSQLFFGQLHSAFVLHCEDYDLGSISYLHEGAPKVWWVIPPAFAPLLEQKMAEALPDQSRACAAFLRHKQAMVTPKQLDNWEIPYNKIVQNPGDFVILPSKAYHMVMNRGWNCAQVINFSTAETYKYVKCHSHYMCYCNPQIYQIFLKNLILKYEPEKYEEFMSGQMEDYHPIRGYSNPVKILSDPLFYKKYYEMHNLLRDAQSAINPFTGEPYKKKFVPPLYRQP